MNIRFTPFLFLLLLSSFTVFSQSFAPANKNATKETRALLSDLYSIRGKKILSGQHNYVHDDCAWGKFTYRLTPVNKIRFKSFSQAIPDQKKNINSSSISIEDVAKVKTQLNLSGSITEVVEKGKSFLAELKFAGSEPVKCRMELVSSADVKRQPDVRLRYGPHWKHGMDVYYPDKKGEKPLAAVVFIHGGGWSALDKAAKGETAQWYNDHGLAYISVN